jgi:hypothetical protein
MKRLMILGVLGLLVSSTAGCRVAECWRYAWNSRFPQRQQTVVMTEPCVVADSCVDTCSSPCAPCGAAPMIAPGPAVSN